MGLDNARILLNALLIGAFAMTAVGYGTESIAVMIFALILIIAFILLWFILWRCPHCSEHLGRMGSYKYCKHCGKELYK